MTQAVYLVSTKWLHDSWWGLQNLTNRRNRALLCCLSFTSWWCPKWLLATNHRIHIFQFHLGIFYCLFSQQTQRDFCFQGCIWRFIVIFIPWFWIIYTNSPLFLKKNVWGCFPLWCVMSERTKFNQAQLSILARATGQTLRNQMAKIILGCQYCFWG